MADSTISFIRDFRLDDAPAHVVHVARRSLLDLVGVAAAGSQLPVSRIGRAVAHAHFSGSVAPFLFDGRRAGPAGAAFANANTIDSFDSHDGHPLTKGHAGCGAAAGLLAFAGDGHSLSGAEFLAHLIVGHEIGVRAGMALHATAVDYHASGAWVALAVAAIGARAAGLDATGTREALGIAEYHGPRSQMMRCIDHPTMVKDGSGWGAMAGVMAALLAREGFTGAPAATVEGAGVEALWRDLGARWRIGENYFKPYPVCRWAQPAMEAAASLAREHAFDHLQVAAITVRTFAEASRLSLREPATTEEAQYSLPFPLAALLVRGRVGPSEIDGAGLTDADILRLSHAVTLVEESRFSQRFPAERWAGVEVTLADGRHLVSPACAARGDAEAPLSDKELSSKFHGLMAASGLENRAAAIEDMIMTLDTATVAAPLIEALSRPVRPDVATVSGAAG